MAVENQDPIFGDTEDTDEDGRHKGLKNLCLNFFERC